MLKLMGLEYTIKYRKGKENLAADALSRVVPELSDNQAITASIPAWIEEIAGSYEGDSKAQQLLMDTLLPQTATGDYSQQHGILRYKRRLYVGSNGDLRNTLVDQLHSTAIGGHSGIDNTYRRIKQHFYWPGLKGEVERRVKACEVCIKNKVDGTPYAGLLQPLQIPTEA